MDTLKNFDFSMDKLDFTGLKLNLAGNDLDDNAAPRLFYR
jgi:hypothetical protein